MLMRAAEGVEGVDCEDPAIALACAMETDECPAACRDNGEEKTDEKVKSGDLEVTAKAAEGAKAILEGTSDLDTLTFKTSEEVTISSITLERYGFSTIADVATVQLEDEDGNIIADAKELNNKGQVKLSIKKDYRKVDWTYKATIVLNAKNPKPANYGSSIGFKVVAAESTAKNLNLDDYSPYLYDFVSYDGSKVEFSIRQWATKDYSWEAGKSYEVAKFRVKAPADSAILVKGFTLTDKKSNVIDADKYAKDVTVTFNGKEVDGVKWNINKDDELVVSFDEVEVAGKETATIAVNMSFSEDFENFGALKWIVQYRIKNISNFNAVDKKTGTRIGEDATNDLASIAAKWTTYQFNGGKVKITGSKLGTVNAAAGSTNVKVAEWEITVTEALRGSAEVAAKTTTIAGMIDGIRLVINGEEYDGTLQADGVTFKFSWLEIEKSGKVELRVDLKDAPTANGTIEFAGSINSASFTLKYDESGENVVAGQIAGSINVSNIKVQAAKADLTSKVSKEVELIRNETNRKTIFEGTYTAKKGAVTLKEFIIRPDGAYGFNTTDKATFYITVNGEEYDADYDATVTTACPNGCAKWDIDDIEVADGKSVNVKVEIEMSPVATALNANETFNVALAWEDDDNNPAGEADEDTVKVKVVNQWSLNIDSNARNTVLLKSKKTLAEFIVKPSKAWDDDVILNSIQFSYADSTTAYSDANIKVVVDGDTITVDGTTPGLYKPEITVPAAWVTVKVTLKSETAGEHTLDVTNVNWATPAVTATFKKYFVPATLSITQSKNGDTTKYTVDVDNEDNNSVTDLYFYIDWTAWACTKAYADDLFTVVPACVDTNSDNVCDNAAAIATAEATIATAKTYCAEVAKKTGTLSETDNKLSAVNDEKAKSITAIRYSVWATTYTILKSVYEDFFDAGSDDLMVYSNK